MGDMDGKIVVVTGGNSGIGKETAVQLAQKGATVAITSRDATRGASAAADIAKKAGVDHVDVIELDLSSFASIRAAAAEILKRYDRLDVLINNGGAILTKPSATEEGFESTLGANHLGHFLLTQLLIDRLRATGHARVVTVASIAHRGAVGVTRDDFYVQDGYRGMQRYSVSKLANIQFARELARREKEAGSDVSSFAVHPGGVRSGFARDGDAHGIIAIGVQLTAPLSISPSQGAAASVYAASQLGLESQSGAYLQRSLFGNYGPVKIVQPSAAGQNDPGAAALWDVSEELVASATT